MRLIDTHCHIDLDSFDEDRTDVIGRALESGITDMLVIGFEPERWVAAEALAAEYPFIRVAAGLHPNSATRFNDELLDDIASQVTRPEVVAIGETGIDLYWDDAPFEIQQRAFKAQIGLARELDVPFIVHQRDAESEVLEVLKSMTGPLNGVLHCFTGDWQYAQEILKLGMHIGLGGAITFKSRTDLHAAAAQIPLDRVVLETDAPFMAPVPIRGKRNEPAYVQIVAERLAELQSESIETIASATTQNAMTLFPGLGTSSPEG
ncbi:MAG: TatD family hydrolase [Thermomicrobiaceae bacterium]